MSNDLHTHQQLVHRGFTKSATRNNVALHAPQQSSSMNMLLERLAEVERASQELKKWIAVQEPHAS